MSTVPDALSATRLRGLRANSLAASVILLIEYGLGMWVNLYGDLPSTDRGANIATGFGRAVANGPVGLSIHALFGIILLISAVTAVVRSVLVGRPPLIVLTAVSLIAIVVSASSGATFVGKGSDAASMSMAIATGVAIGAYAVVLFIAGGRQTTAGSSP